MPTVPRYVGPQIQENALQGGEQRAPDRSMNGAAQLADAASTAYDAQTKFDQIKDSQAAFAADTAVKSKWLAADADLRKKYRGANTEGYLEEVNKFWDGARDEQMQSLNPRAQRLVAQSLGTARLQAQAGAQHYYTTETERAQDDAFVASQSVETQRAVDTGPAAAATSSRLLRDRNAQQAAIKGWTPEMLEAANTRATTDLHTQMLQAISLSGSATAAKDAQTYYDQYKGEIDAKQHAEIEAKLRTTGLATQAQTLGAELASRFGYTQTTEAQKVIDGMPGTPELKAAVRAELEHRHLAMRQDANDQNGLLMGKLDTMVQQGMSLAKIQATPEFQQVRDQGTVLKLVRERTEHAAALQASIEARDNARTQRLLAQQERDGMAAKWAYSDPTVLASMTRPQITGLALSIGPHNTQALLDRYDSLGKSESKLREARIDHESFNTIAANMGLNPYAPKTVDEKAALATAKERVEAGIDVWQRAHNNQEMPRDLKEKLMTDMAARQVSTAGFLWGTNESNLLTLPDADIEKLVVPPEHQQAIIAAARKAKGDSTYVPSNREIGQKYLQMQQRELTNGR